MAQKAAPKSAQMAKLWQFRQGHPNPHFREKVQRGTKRKFFKNRPKSSPRLKGLRALWRKWHYPLFSMPLKVQGLEKDYGAKSEVQKCPNGQVMAIFRKVTQNPHFLKKCKGGTKENF